jgi:hypothetical protein
MMELAMRYMDILRVDGKRWFYRPVMARVLGHLGAANEKEENVTATTKGTAATAATVATAAAVTAPAKSVIPKGKKPVPVVVTKVEPAENTVVIPEQYTVADLEKLSRKELSRLTNDEISPTVSRAEFARIFAAASEESPINKTVLAPVSTKAPSQKVVVTKAEGE